ncbi:MAG: nitroreductase family protein [Bacteroidia bacterium]
MNTVQISTLIKARKSTYPRQFTGEKIERETIKNWLELANWAPNHKLTEPWRFVVFDNEALNALVNQHKELYLANNSPEMINEAKELNKKNNFQNTSSYEHIQISKVILS